MLEFDGIPTDYMRITVNSILQMKFGNSCKIMNRIYVVEINRDGQLQQLLTLEFPMKRKN